MRKTEQELRRELDATTRKIVRLVARAYGYGDPDNLNPRRRLEDVDDIIDDYEQALQNGVNIANWQPFDKRLAGTEIRLLLQQRHQLERRILDLYEAGVLKKPTRRRI